MAGEKHRKTTEGDMVRLRRKENKRASDLVDGEGLTQESASAILLTRILNSDVLNLVLNALGKEKTPPEK